MAQTLTGLFDDYDDAKAAVSDLETAGVPASDISIVASNAHGRHDGLSGSTRHSDGHVVEDAGQGAKIGATVGGVGGLLAGLGLLAIPGLGPVVAAGWLASTLAGVVGGAAIGGAAGGLVGGLTQAGVPEHDAHVYAEGVRRGGTLVTAKVTDGLVVVAKTILSEDKTVDIGARRHTYQQEGWTQFDENAAPYGAAEIEREQARNLPL